MCPAICPLQNGKFNLDKSKAIADIHVNPSIKTIVVTSIFFFSYNVFKKPPSSRVSKKIRFVFFLFSTMLTNSFFFRIVRDHGMEFLFPCNVLEGLLHKRRQDSLVKGFTRLQKLILIQTESICRRQNNWDLDIEICFGKGRKQYRKMRKCR